MIRRLLTLMAVFVLVQGITYSADKKFASTPVLDKVNSPADIKTMNSRQLNSLARDIRWGILNHSNKVGGHLGSDLGIVEATIALHYVFDSPKDKIIFDVSHQSYPHKMITGRREGFTDPLNHTEISGYSNQDESKHDFFKMGHTSTSISLASGMAKARDLKGEKYNVIALIGDGSLSGGEALEGLNSAAVLGSNFIIIVNDNEMCIAPTNGGLYKALAELRSTKGKSENNMFKSFGYEYFYVENGNDIQKLIEAFSKVKDTNKPTVVHIHTQKGKGYYPAERSKEEYHWISAGGLGSKRKRLQAVNYETITTEYLVKAKKAGKPVVAVTPATPGATGFTQDFRKKMGKNYVDVDIAEQHSVGFVSGIASNGGKPVLAICSSFVQRAYDQLSQDFALNKAPATILVFNNGINAMDMTHLGIFDIPLISNIPNIVYMAPTCIEEYKTMLDWSVNQKEYPVVIRIPSGEVVSTRIEDKTDYSKINKYQVKNEGARVAIIAEGSMYPMSWLIRNSLIDIGINPTIINPVYLSGIDKEVLEGLKKNHEIVITIEDGCLDGGFGEKITRFYGGTNMKVLNYGADKVFTDRVPLEQLYERYRLTPEQITADIKTILKNK